MLRKLNVVLGLMLALLFSAGAMAHGDKQLPLYVASGGSDSGRCDNATTPCGSIGYALKWVGKGGQIRVAQGTYEVANAEDLFQILAGDINIQGGFQAADAYTQPGAIASTLVGVPPLYADELSQRGFHVLADQKGIDREVAAQTGKLLAVHKTLKSSLAATPCTGGTVNGMACSNVDLLSHVGAADISTFAGDAADVWGFVDLNSNREYAIAGFQNGTAVFDVTDAENPREVGFIDGQSTAWRDIKVYQFWNDTDARWNAHAYITTDGSSDGLFVIDLSGLPHSVAQVNYPSDFTAAHNVYATNTDFGTGLSLNGDAPTLVIAGSNVGSGPYRAYSIDAPESPSFEVMPGSGRSDYMHDAASMIITDNRKDTQCVNATTYCELLFDFNELTFDVWDITNTASPVRLSRTNYANVAYVHSGWWSEDKQFLFVHDELDERNFGLNTTLRVFSLADLRAPVAAGTWTGPSRAIDHNGFVRGNRYYMSNYSRGLTILDITDPANPTLAGRLDTYPASDGSSFVGAWGTYPYFHSGNIAISDIGSGFYMAADRTLDVEQGSIAFSAPSYGGNEGNSLQIGVSRTGSSGGAVSVGYEVVPATGGSADIQINSGVLNWESGDSADKVIDISLLNDATEEGLERMLIRLVAPTGGATLASSNVASVYVGEAGANSVVSFEQSIINIAERGFATAVAVIERTGSAAGAASVDYAISAGDADAGVDFLGETSGTINWAAGDADPKWIEFTITDDGVAESAEFIELALSNSVNASLGSQPTLRINIANGSGINNAPNAVAGAGQTVTSGASVTLDGSMSNDPDGDALSYAWVQLSGDTVTLGNASAATASFVAPTVSSDRIFRFELTVSDNGGLDNTSVTSVTVRKAGAGKSGGSGGGSLSWWLLAILFTAILFERVALDNRLFPVRSR